MVDKDKPSRAMAIVTRLRPGVADGRSPVLVGMVSAFDKAEAAARLRSGTVRKTFLVSCRVGGGGKFEGRLQHAAFRTYRLNRVKEAFRGAYVHLHLDHRVIPHDG